MGKWPRDKAEQRRQAAAVNHQRAKRQEKITRRKAEREAEAAAAAIIAPKPKRRSRKTKGEV